MGGVITFVLSNWKLIALGVLAAIIVTWIGVLKLEVSHYKAKAEAEHAQFVLYKNQAEAKEAKLEAGAAAISKLHEHALAEADAQRDLKTKAVQEKIAANEELKRTRISFAAVRLLNESTRPTEEPTPAVQANAGSTTGTEAGTVPLSVVGRIVAENNGNHQACTERLTEWITFWGEYQAVVREAATDARP
jgi:hypothetical protein